MADENKPVKFDPNKIMDGVKDKIKATFIDLMPEEAWDAMVQTELDRYFKTTINHNYSSGNQNYTPFARLVHNTLEEYAKEKLKEHLASPEFTVTWNTNGQPQISEAVKQMMVTNSGEILMNMFGGMLSQAMVNIRHNMG